MSGSGGGDLGGGGQYGNTTTCESLIINTMLSSPKDDVIAKFDEGDVLDVELQYSPQPIVVCLYKGEVAGGVASSDLPKLRECLDRGTRYVAEVLGKVGGQVRVRIRAIG